MLFTCYFALCVWLSTGRTCFRDPVPDPINITFDGINLPVGIWKNAGGGCSEIVSEIYAILLTEKLGFNVYMETGPASELILGKLAGCSHEGFEITGDCGSPRRFHVCFENWLTDSPWQKRWLTDLEPYGVPVNLGSMGYEGKSGMFVLDGALRAGLEDSGISLDFYRSYNASWHDPSKYTPAVQNVDLHRLKTCEGSAELGYPGLAEIYLAATSDVEGVQEVNGVMRLRCWQNKWWFAPACRGNISQCSPVLMPNTAWGMPEMMQQAFWHNMPLAFATAMDGHFVNLAKELQSLVYTYLPDSTFLMEKPSQVIFPEHSAEEYARTIYKTMKNNAVLSKWAAAGFDVAARKAFEVAKNLRLSFPDAMLLLERHQRTGDMWETACSWLMDNEASWQAWIPNETICTLGKGLVNSSGSFVDEAALPSGVTCDFCPTGTFSADVAWTRICRACDAGTSQIFPGQTECTPCAPGSVSSMPGAMECEPCSLGRYSNSSGQTECSQCGPPDQVQFWTTSMMVSSNDQEQWIPLQRASSESFCSCIEGYFLFQGRCERCQRGAKCPGSNQLTLFPGFFSSQEEPGAIYQCYGESSRCPGGAPGTCAAGRNVDSIACSRCMDSKRANGGECSSCKTGDYFLLIVVIIAVCCAIVILYAGSMQVGQKTLQPGNLLIAALGLSQMITVVQQLAVFHQLDIPWGEPFLSILTPMEIFTFDLDLISVGCLAPISPVSQFLLQSLLVLMVFAVNCLVHFIFVARKKKGLQLSVLGSTIGTISTAFFISICSTALTPFRCFDHPNGRSTVQTYHSVLCDMQDEHLSMSLIGGVCFSLPIAFLTICCYITLVKLPAWLAKGEVKLIRACSFLFVRFRPGAEVFSVIFAIRNALVVLCPLLPSATARILCMSLVLHTSLVLVAFEKPWRAMLGNLLDMFLLSGLLFILDMGAMFLVQVDESSMAAICVVIFTCMFLSMVAAMIFGVSKYVMLKYRKPFRFFLCHQKSATGSYARLLKMELEKRGSQFKTFVDWDDLTDLTKLFSYVGQDTQTLVILGSAHVLTRKWCMGEMITARGQKVDTILLTFPGFAKPDSSFIENYITLVPDITDLATFGIGLEDVEATLRWISRLETIEVPQMIRSDSISSLVNLLTRSHSPGKFAEILPNFSRVWSSSCLILVDLQNMEAAATAFILLGLVRKRVISGMSGVHDMISDVMKRGERVPENVNAVLLICSDGCFSSLEVANWLFQVFSIESCALLPVIAEDGFQFPSEAFFDGLAATPQLQALDLDTYVKIIKAIFEEIAVFFSPRNYSSTAKDLEFRASQVADRLTNGLKPLANKVQVQTSEVFSKSFTDSFGI